MTIGTYKKNLNKIRPVVFELQSVKVWAHLTSPWPWCLTFQGQIFFEGRYWPNKGLQWIWVNSDHFGWRYKFVKFPQWWEIGIFGIFRDFFGPDPINRFWQNFGRLCRSWISTQEKNLESIAWKLWPVECEHWNIQTYKHTNKHGNETTNILDEIVDFAK